MSRETPAIHSAALGDVDIPYSPYPSSRYRRWIPAPSWLLYRALPTLFVIGIWALLIFTALSFIPIFFPAIFPIYALPLLAVGASVFVYLFGDKLRSLFKRPYKASYKFLLRKMFSKAEEDAEELVEHWVDKRSFAQQLVDYLNYYFNRAVRAKTEEDQALKIRIAQFNARWGALAKFVLNTYFLTMALMFFVPLAFGLSLSLPLTLGLIAIGIFGGVCSSLENTNLLSGGLVALIRHDKDIKQLEADSSKWDCYLGRLFCAAHGLGVGVACFAVVMELVGLLSAYAFVVANPFVIPVLLAVAAVCSLAVARGYYALCYKVWLKKKYSLKGFFSGTDGDGKPVGSFQRIFGFLGAILIGVTVSLSFVMLNGSAFAEAIASPIYTLMGAAVQFHLSVQSIAAFVFTGIVGGIGVGIVYFCGSFKLFRDFGRWLDERLASYKPREVVYTSAERDAVEAELKSFQYRAEDHQGPAFPQNFRERFFYKHWHLEKNLRTLVIILFNGLVVGSLAAMPNIILLGVLAPYLMLPIGISIFAIAFFSAVCKDYMNFVAGQTDLSHSYKKARQFLYEAQFCDRHSKKLNDEFVSELSRLREENSSMDSLLEKIGNYEGELSSKQYESSSLRQLMEQHALGESVAGDELQKALLEEARCWDKKAKTFREKARAYRDAYDPHLYVSFLTALVRVVSNALAAILTPFALVWSDRESEPKVKKPEVSVPTVGSLVTGEVVMKHVNEMLDGNPDDPTVTNNAPNRSREVSPEDERASLLSHTG